MPAADLPKYQFLPWTRRGLAATIRDADTNTTLPARARLPVAITVTNVAPAGIDLELYGPGDVIGVDPRLIVRTDPRPNVTDVEPNYLAAIEFDFPDFPWMFTPAKARSADRLRPWCVLVVLDRETVAAPKVIRGAPLPVITIPEAASTSELPDLAESWAWAHVQVMSDNKDSEVLEQEMAGEPNLNVSRLMCPRHLAPNHRYVACLVPAFDLGVQRGLGQTPVGNTLTPAWDVATAREVKLPVYFHWEFATGPVGDFESLARKLTPVKASGEMGFQRMFVGSPGGGLATTPANDEKSYLKMEGVLRAPKAKDSTINDVDGALRVGLRKALHVPGQRLLGSEQVRIALAPPIYGEWHLNHHKVPDFPNPPEWMRELNLDLRMRAAAGLGGEVVRANQEDFMHVAWEQVGDVIKANELLNRARFSLDVHRRTYKRHYVPLPEDRLLQITSALHLRTLMVDKTVRAKITVTSLPDASVDPALRRLTSPQRSWLKSVARRGKFATGSSRSARSKLIQSINARKVRVDPGQFVPDSIVGAAILDELKPAAGAIKVDLSPFGIQAQVAVNTLQRMQTTRGELVKIPLQNIPRMIIRDDLSSRGVILRVHLDRLRELETQILQNVAGEGQELPAQFNLPVILSQVSSEAKQNPEAVAILVNVEAGSPILVHSLRVDTGGNILLGGTPIASLEADLRRRDRTELTRVITGLPAGTLPGKRIATDVLPTISERATRELGVGLPPRPPVGEPVTTLPPTITLLPPVTDPLVITRFQKAFSEMEAAVRLDTADPLPQFVEFGVKAASATLVARINPDVMIVRRVKTMIGGEAGSQLETIPGIQVLPTFDRIMVAPEIAAPMYEYLAKYDRERFLPGIGQLPADSITLLETNPRFIESFMVGLNYEMNRELLWREYPTDQRGTPLRRFWDWTDRRPDLPDPIHKWKSGGLGTHIEGGAQIVLLVRGQLLRRYPNTMIYAWRADAVSGELKRDPGPLDILEPIFRGTFDPDVSFAGFPMDDQKLLEGRGWFFVLQEQLTEPRFGFDEDKSAVLNHWSDVGWPNVEVASGKYLRIQGNPLNPQGQGKVLDGATFGRNAAHMAVVTLQKPMRVAIHSKHMVEV